MHRFLGKGDGLIPNDVIEEIRNRSDVVRLIGEAVPLKRSGRNYLGLCPFHEEKTPSFTVSPQKQLYHCFGCGEGGTIFSFLMKFHHMSFPEALEQLADKAGIDLEPYQKGSGEWEERRAEKERLLKVTVYARDRYHQLFLDESRGATARKYATSRGLNQKTWKTFSLGFAPPAWDFLAQSFVRDQISAEDGVRVGLLARRKEGGGFYDVFRNRLLFPIATPKGEVVGFGGRALGDDPPKYLNSSQTPLFDKGRLLFGLGQAEEFVRKEGRLIVVEGYLDQAVLSTSGIGHVVATLGTALTEQHAQLITRYSDKVVLAFDGDDAGKKAVRRSIPSLVAQGATVSVLSLPTGTDPDSFVRKHGVKAFHGLEEKATGALDYFVEEFFLKAPDLNRKAEAVAELAAAGKRIGNVYLREVFFEEVVAKTGIEKRALQEGLSQSTIKRPMAKGTPINAKSDSTVPAEEFLLLRLVAEIPQARERFELEKTESLFSSETASGRARRWLEVISKFASQPHRVSTFVDAWEHEETRPCLAKMFMTPGEDLEETWPQIWSDCVKKMRVRQIRRLAKAVAEAEALGKSDVVRELSMRVQELKRQEMRS